MSNDIVISSTFVIDKILPGLSWFKNELGIDFNFFLTEYNQVLQNFLNKNSSFYTASKFNIAFIRVSDFQHYDQITENQLDKDKVKIHIQNLIDAIEIYSVSTSNKLLIVLPDDPFLDKEMMRFFEGKINDITKAYSHIMLFPSQKLLALTPFAQYQAESDQLMHIPYSQEFYNGLAYVTMRFVFTQFMSPYKVILLDCDNTLWSGVCAELGPSAVQISKNYHYLQHFLLEQVKSGKIIALCSKNIEADVWAVFEENTDMVLKREHVTLSKINWEPKSKNIYEIAKELDLSPDSFIFMDDNAIEIEEVKANCPDVLSLQVPDQHHDFTTFLASVWAFDAQALSKEDAKRTLMYQQNIERNKLKEGSHSFESFLEDLKLNISITPIKKEQIQRVAQLTERTNQFNSSTKRRSTTEVDHFINQDKHSILTVSVEDRFGDYGLVGAIFYDLQNPEILKVDSFLMSCRVLGRGVEYHIFKYLAQIAVDAKAKEIQILFNATNRNYPIKAFLSNVAKLCSGEANQIHYIFSPEKIVDTHFSARHFNIETYELEMPTEKQIIKDPPIQNKIIEYIMEKISTPEHFISLQKNSIKIDTQQLTIEESLCLIFSSVLKQPIESQSRFSDMAGSSIHLVEIHLKICEEFHIEFPLAEMFDHLNISSLSKTIKEKISNSS